MTQISASGAARLRALASMFGLAAALAACGGDGGSPTPPPAPTPSPAPVPTPPPPAPAPAPVFDITAVTPADGSTGVARDVVIEEDFTLPVDPAFDPKAVALVAPDGDVMPTDATVAGTAMHVAPSDGALPGGTTYTMTLAAGLSDGQGHALVTPLYTHFTTAPQHWDAHATDIGLLPNFYSGTQPSSGIDPLGNVTAVWRLPSATFGGPETLVVARLDAATGTWGAAAPVGPANAGVGVGAFDVNGEPDGSTTLYWIESNSSTATTHLARYAPTTGQWTALPDVPTMPAGASLPMAASHVTDILGNITLLTTDDSGLYAVRFDKVAGTWGAPRAAMPPIASIGWMQSCTDDAGDIVVAAIQLGNADKTLVAVRYDAATDAWGAVQPVGASPLTSLNDHFSLACNRHGGAALAWTRDDGLSAANSVHASLLNPGNGTWSADARIDQTDPAGLGANHARVALDGGGNATLIWTEYGGTRFSRFEPHTVQPGWSTPQWLTTSMDTELELAVDVAGNVTALLVESNAPTAIQFLASAGQWQSPVLLGVPATGTQGFANAPVATMDRTGTLTSIWFAENGTAGGGLVSSVTSNRFK